MTIKNLSRLLTPMREIFVGPKLLLVGLPLSVLIFSVSLFYPNFSAIQYIWSVEGITLSHKAAFLYNLYGGIFTNHSVVSLFLSVTISILAAAQLALLYQLVKRQRTPQNSLKQHSLLTATGLIVATLGLGCAACGTLILSSLLTLFGGAWLLTILPWHGQEIAVLAIAILVTSNYLLLKRLGQPLTCTLEPTQDLQRNG